jgi:2-polyprenyl-3-methyl-5-hydroxy-6-metoxy-1,4-benzoquinol methylase
MPSSTLNCVPLVVAIVRALRPSSILDVGPGFGKYGLLLREYLEIWELRYQKKDWKVRLDCVEAFESYLTPVHEYVYDKIYVGDICELVDELGEYNLILMVDVLEHLTKEQGESLLRSFKSKTQHILVVCPRQVSPQGEVFENPYEVHKHQWTEEELGALGASFVKNNLGKIIALIPGELS